MNKTRLQSIKIADSVEHLRIITDEVRIQNDTLNKLLSEKKRILDDISNAELKLIEIKRESSSIMDEASKLLKIAKDKEISVSDKESKIIILKKETEDYLSSKEKEIEDKKNYANSFIEIIRKESDSLIKSVSLMKEEKLSLESLLKSMERNISEATRELKTVDLEVFKKKEELAKLIQELDSFVASSNEKRKLINEEIEAEKKKVEKPLQMLIEKEVEIKRKDGNLKTLVARFKKEFKKLHPDLDPKI